MPDRGELLAGVLIGLGFLALVAVAEAWRKWGGGRPELTRKLVHMGGGIGCLALPFVIDSPWVVLGLALGMMAVFLVGKRTGRLPSLYSVERASKGVEYYPLVVFLLFVLARDKPWMYVSCVLVLAVADGLAALIGGKYGRVRYEVEGEYKSLEGSLVFLVVTFLAILLPLLLWKDAALPSPARCVMATLLTAALVTGFEAVSLGGRDNLWVPLGTFFVLTKILRQSWMEMAVQNVSLLAIGVCIAFAAASTKAFNVGAAILISLWAYACWSLGSFDWALPVFAGIAVFLVVRVVTRESLMLKITPVLRALLPAVVLLFVANFSLSLESVDLYGPLYGPFLVTAVVVVTQVAWSRLLRHFALRGVARRLAATGVALAVALVIALPAWWFQTDVSPRVIGVVTSLGVAAGVIYDLVLGAFAPDPEGAPRRHNTRPTVTIAAALVAIALEAARLAPAWNPA